MRYTVTWQDETLDDLAEVWMAASNRRAVQQSVDEIDRILANDPETHAESPGEGLYKLTMHPIRVLFEVRAQDRIVEVVRIIHE